MLLTSLTDSENPTTMGLGKSTEYQISTNGKAFKIMSDTLYQNKIGSIVREVSCNAIDSHNESGKGDVPFEVHLPDMYEPWFSVRDFGLGMDDESVRVNYCTLFLSTKDNSNDSIGAFGLGSKTPFAYTDSFTITSIFNGERRTYIAAMGADGTPSVTEMSFDQTDECNGLEIQIGVDSADFNKFRNELSDQLQFFKVKPIVLNGKGFKFNELPEVFNSYGKVNILAAHHNSSTYIIQGGVGYPLDFSQIRDKFTSDEFGFAYSLFNRGCYLQFDIGDIEVTPSREGISYKYHTIKNIVDAFKNAQTMFTDGILAELAGMATDWERVKHINAGGKMVVDVISKLKLYPNITFSHDECHKNVKAFMDTRKVQTKNADGTLNPAYDADYFKYEITRYEMPNTRLKRVTLTVNSLIKNTLNNVFIFDDMPKSSQARLRYYMAENYNNSYAYVFRSHKDSATDADVQNVVDALDGLPVVRLSTLAIPPREYTERKSGGAQAIYWALTENTGDTRGLDPIYDSIKDADGGYYVVAQPGAKFYLSPRDWAICEMLNLDKEIYVVRPRNMAYIKESPEWVPLNEIILKKIVEENAKDHTLDNMKLGCVKALQRTSWDDDTFKFLSTVDIDDAVLRNVMKFYNRSDIKRNSSVVYESLMNYDNEQLVVDFRDRFTKRINDARAALNTKYPLLSKLFSGYYGVEAEHYDHIKLYMQAVNNVVDSVKETE